MLKLLVKTMNDTSDYYHVIDSTRLILAPEDNSGHRVADMQLYGEGESAYIYIGTETDIYRMPVQSCPDYNSSCECITSRDPYCGFDGVSGTCVSLTTSNSQILTQDLVNGTCLTAETTQMTSLATTASAGNECTYASTDQYTANAHTTTAHTCKHHALHKPHLVS